MTREEMLIKAENIARKKIDLQNKIYNLRLKRSKLMKDAYSNYNDRDSKESSVDLLEDVVEINTSINEMRDRVDEYNKQLFYLRTQYHLM